MKKLMVGIVAAGCAFGAFADFDIAVDLKAMPIKDVRTSTCGPEIGYAGSVLTVAGYGSGGELYWTVTNRVEMSRAMRESGAWFERVWDANGWFARRGPNPYDPNSTDKKEAPHKTAPRGAAKTGDHGCHPQTCDIT